MVDATMSGTKLTLTAKIARWSAKRRWWVLAGTLLTLAAGIAMSAVFEPQLQDGDGGVGDSKTAADVLDEKFPRGTPSSENLLFGHPDLSVDDPAYQATVEALVARLRELPQVTTVESFYENGDPSRVSADRRVLRVSVLIDREIEVDGHRADAVLDAVAEAREANEADGYTIAVVGSLTTNREVGEMVDEDFGRILVISLSLGLIIMVLAFRAVVAAVIPLTLAVGAIVTATGIAAVISQAYALNGQYTEMILLMGLAVGMDYSLFIVSRYRNERQAGREKLDAITVASNTTGRAVFYAGITVVVSLTGLALTDHPVFISLALGAILVVLVTIVASFTYIPAVLSILGDNINRLHVPILSRMRGNGIWGAVTDRVMARPLLFAAIAGVGLIAVAVPAASINLGFPSGSKAFNDAVSAKHALRLLEDHFSSGLTDPAFVVVEADDVTTAEVQGAVAALLERVGADPATYYEPFRTVVNPDGDALYVQLGLSGDVDAAEAAVRELRNEIVPSTFGAAGVDGLVTGAVAGNMDFREHMYSRAPLVFGFVLGLAFLLLLVMFRSVVIPVKSIILNLLSVGAAYGVLVAVFQWGWGLSLLGSESSGVIVSWLPLFLFAILFGLSMDYHMLLLSRVKESYDVSHDNSASVSAGVKLTAGQITSAAAIMVGVFSAFALGRDIGLQQFGVGLGVSVLIDATVVRSVLLPATMKLLGDWNWYLPRWLEWLPKVTSAAGPPESGAAADSAGITVPQGGATVI